MALDSLDSADDSLMKLSVCRLPALVVTAAITLSLSLSIGAKRKPLPFALARSVDATKLATCSSDR